MSCSKGSSCRCTDRVRVSGICRSTASRKTPRFQWESRRFLLGRPARYSPCEEQEHRGQSPLLRRRTASAFPCRSGFIRDAFYKSFADKVRSYGNQPISRRALCSACSSWGLPEKSPLAPERPFRRPSGIGVSGVERHGCRESVVGPGMARRRGPLKLRWSEGIFRLSEKPDAGARPFGSFWAPKGTRPRGRNKISQHTPKRRRNTKPQNGG